MTEPGDRLFAQLPAVFRDSDGSGDLARLLGVFEALFFAGSGGHSAALPGLERQLPGIPALFSPQAEVPCQGTEWRTPDAFLHWLADWLSFTPHAGLAPAVLRRVLAGIVPLYGLRGTREYLLRLIKLCFSEEVAQVEIDDRPTVGFTIGQSVLGVDTRLARSRPFWFKVVIEPHDAPGKDSPPNARKELEPRLRAIIDFAKPAHTAYELHWRPRPAGSRAAHASPLLDEIGG